MSRGLGKVQRQVPTDRIPTEELKRGVVRCVDRHWDGGPNGQNSD